MSGFVFAAGVENSASVITGPDGRDLRRDDMSLCGHDERHAEGFACARLAGEHLCVPGFRQGVGLQGQILIGRRDARVADQRLSRFSIQTISFDNYKSGTGLEKAKVAYVCRRGLVPAVPLDVRLWERCARSGLLFLVVVRLSRG